MERSKEIIQKEAEYRYGDQGEIDAFIKGAEFIGNIACEFAEWVDNNYQKSSSGGYWGLGRYYSSINDLFELFITNRNEPK